MKLSKPCIFLVKVLNLSLIILFGIIGCQKDKEYSHSTQSLPKAALVSFKGIEEKLPVLKMLKADKEFDVGDCRSFIENIKVSTVVETDSNFKVYGHYQSCISSHIFQLGQAASKSFYQGDFSELIYANLDVASFRSSIRQSLDDKTHTFKELKYQFNKEENIVDFDSPTWRYKFTLLARGDFNKDGVEDMLVGFLDEAKTASYYANVTLVLIKTDNNSLWKAEEAEQYLTK